MNIVHFVDLLFSFQGPILLRDLQFRSPSRRGQSIYFAASSGSSFFFDFASTSLRPCNTKHSCFPNRPAVDVSVSEGALPTTRVSPRQSEKNRRGGFFFGVPRSPESTFEAGVYLAALANRSSGKVKPLHDRRTPDRGLTKRAVGRIIGRALMTGEARESSRGAHPRLCRGGCP